jgi:hypothetical protein
MIKVGDKFRAIIEDESMASGLMEVTALDGPTELDIFGQGEIVRIHLVREWLPVEDGKPNEVRTDDTHFFMSSYDPAADTVRYADYIYRRI